MKSTIVFPSRVLKPLRLICILTLSDTVALGRSFDDVSNILPMVRLLCEPARGILSRGRTPFSCGQAPPNSLLVCNVLQVFFLNDPQCKVQKYSFHYLPFMILPQLYSQNYVIKSNFRHL